MQRTFAAFAERDLDALVDLMDAEIEFLPVTANLTTGGMPYRGHDGIARYFEDVARVWPELRLFPEEVLEGRREDVVVVLGRVLARGGGMILDRPTGWVFLMRNGKIARLRVYGSHEEAVEAAS
ncbi:MAG TPA: nuclear transport factor 2 family protein [Solirubrobacteraceae bacterium]